MIIFYYIWFVFTHIWYLGIHLLGFKPRSYLKPYHHVKSSHFIYPDEEVGRQRSARLCLSVEHAAHETVITSLLKAKLCRYLEKPENTWWMTWDIILKRSSLNLKNTARSFTWYIRWTYTVVLAISHTSYVSTSCVRTTRVSSPLEGNVCCVMRSSCCHQFFALWIILGYVISVTYRGSDDPRPDAQVSSHWSGCPRSSVRLWSAAIRDAVAYNHLVEYITFRDKCNNHVSLLLVCLHLLMAATVVSNRLLL